MAEVIAAIGVPSSGKTTVLKPFAEENGYVYICPDDIRQELTGNLLDNSRNPEAWEIAFARMREALREDRAIAFDATQARVRDRRAFALRARQEGADRIIGAFADVSLAEAKERNTKRSIIVPEHAIERMYRFLEDDPPRIEDGFDEIIPIETLRKG
jgi:predicted kinase